MKEGNGSKQFGREYRFEKIEEQKSYNTNILGGGGSVNVPKVTLSKGGARHLFLQNSEEVQYLIGLTRVANLGPVTCRNLISYFGSPREVFKSTPNQLRRIYGIGAKTIASIRKINPLLEAEKEIEYAIKNGTEIKTYKDPRYPQNLHEIYDAPLVLYQKGEIDLNSALNIAIVGTRRPSKYGRLIAERFSRFYAMKGVNVVSGLAYGIDGEAHQAALRAGGVTTAVLGHGLETVYPQEHAKKAKEIESSGALLTEYPWEVQANARHFPRRNRIISGICQATIVIEAGEKGGALITARMAFQQNREVYAIPGDLLRPTSKGCNKLIRENIAKLLTDPHEVLTDLLPLRKWSLEKNRMADKEKAFASLNLMEKNIMKLISVEPVSLEKVAEKLGLLESAGEVKAILVGLEIRGYLKKQTNGMYFFSS